MQDILAARQAETSTAAEEAPSLIQAVFRERWVVLACVIIAGLAGYLLSNLQQARYTATSRIFLSATGDFDPLQQNQFVNDPGRFVADQVAVLTSSEVLQSVDRFRATHVFPNPVLTPLLLCQNYHLIHHLYPAVPFYRYGRIYQAIRLELEARGVHVQSFFGRRGPPLGGEAPAVLPE